MKQFFTPRGVQIQPYRTLSIRTEEPMTTRRIENGRVYRLCQILPAVPQRLEWVNERNILLRTTGDSLNGAGSGGE